MNRVTPLVRTPAVTLERFDHPPGDSHRDPERESARSHALNLVEAGSFRLKVAGGWQELTAGHVFATTPGLEFSCAHEADHPEDRCLSVRYSDEAVESLRSAGASTPVAAVLPTSNRQAYLGLQLGEEASGDPARAEALAGALFWSVSGPARPSARFRPRQLSWYAARLARAKALVRAHHAEPLSLSRMAREAGMSVYHFARVFAELEGQPPHRYLLGVRIERALARLREGASVTEACFAVGFGSLSHFVTTFRRHVGLRPSEVARGFSRPRS